MTVSIIIPTYNGSNKICNILHSLEKQTVKPDEIIVVVDGSTDNTMEVLTKTVFNLPQLKIIEQSNKGRVAVRNRGASEAGGEILIFLDDDMIAYPNLVEEHINFHTHHAASVCVGILIPNDTITETDYGRYRVWLNDQWNKQIDLTEDIVLLEYPYICAANFSLHKTQFINIGCFDERLKSIVINNDSDAILNCTNTIKRQRQYKFYHQKLIEIKPEIHKGGIREVVLPNIFKTFIYKSIFCNQWMIDAVDKERLLFLPEKIRFKIYDAVVTANGVLFPNIVKL